MHEGSLLVRCWFAWELHSGIFYVLRYVLCARVCLCVCVCVCAWTFTLLIRSWFFYRRIHMPGILRFGACKSCVACQASSLSRSVWIGRWFMHSRPIPNPLFHLQTQQTIYPCHCRPVKSVLFWPSISFKDKQFADQTYRTRNCQDMCNTFFEYFILPSTIWGVFNLVLYLLQKNIAKLQS